jgi:small subunit ribosomal protein S8
LLKTTAYGWQCTRRKKIELVNYFDWRTIVSMHDPVADMLTRIRNGQQAKHQQITLVSSKLKEEIARVLKEEGYIENFFVETLENNLKSITVKLKYYHGRPVIELIKRISRPGLRVYKSYKDLSSIPGFGVAILSTSKGIMTHISAKSKGVGGEVICEVA